MFKPHIGDCNQCPRTGVTIPVKSGACQYCNHENKQASKNIRNIAPGHHAALSNGIPEKLQQECLPSSLERKVDQKSKSQVFKARKPIQYRKKRTGEAEVFKEIWEEREHVCSCCNAYLGTEAKPIFFSHLLAKGTFGLYRLYPDNIWLKCERCHHEWEFGDRSQPKFLRAVEETARLKREYYEFTRVNKIIDVDNGNDTIRSQDVSPG